MRPTSIGFATIPQHSKYLIMISYEFILTALLIFLSNGTMENTLPNLDADRQKCKTDYADYLYIDDLESNFNKYGHYRFESEYEAKTHLEAKMEEFDFAVLKYSPEWHFAIDGPCKDFKSAGVAKERCFHKNIKQVEEFYDLTPKQKKKSKNRLSETHYKGPSLVSAKVCYCKENGDTDTKELFGWVNNKDEFKEIGKSSNPVND